MGSSKRFHIACNSLEETTLVKSFSRVNRNPFLKVHRWDFFLIEKVSQLYLLYMNVSQWERSGKRVMPSLKQQKVHHGRLLCFSVRDLNFDGIYLFMSVES